ncbi:unnamed protein product [Vitrella brassicaformis CCMP3155]|uniref:Uncharacterized protein n=1 Tax=Vitrella brassicaformis (strain CCMP3155) TaxID=1169540 RepID=A0A0G4H3N8_VITBC|nr:unnamed protein product [Vitrella brassicaformis CCMP3155]|eukprot:CEM38236.1 unnamed protein product [Vitrella brassicaformis CCMP3155]
MFASPGRHGVASTRSHPQQEQQHQAGNQQHPLTHLFAEDRCRIPDIGTTLQLRAASRGIRDAFSLDQLRSRLDHSLSRDGDGITHKHPQRQQQASVWWLALVWLWHLCCRVWSWCSGRPSSDQQQHPLAHLFAEDRCCIPDMDTTVQLTDTAQCVRDAFSSTQLRSRLNHSVGRGGIDTPLVQLLRFDQSLEMGDLLAAVWIAEEGGRWDETREVLQRASQCGYCTLPINLTADDINTHPNKTAYGSVARVLAQLMVVGRHIDFGEGSHLQMFRYGNGEVRAIKDEPDFRLTVDPPLPAHHHLYQRHRQQHDPPVVSRIYYSPLINRCLSATSIRPNRYVDGGRLNGLLAQSPHTPVAGCTTTFSWCTTALDQDARVRQLVLTNSSDDFVAWITIWDMGNKYLRLSVVTTEAPVAGAGAGGAFKHRFPVTTRLTRVALGPGVAPFVFDGQV